MGDYERYQQGLYLSPNQQDLLLAALSSNNPSQKPQSGSPPIKSSQSPDEDPSNALSTDNPHANNFGFGDDESPFLDFIPEVDFDFPGSADLIGDLPGLADYDIGGKRKSLDGKSDIEGEETGKKRRESEAKKPGRKPLTSEPTTKRKAQNRAAQRAFRERKEKHLKDLEESVEKLQRTSKMANQENGLLRAQVERLQVELREYRKRLSWMASGSGNAISAMSSNSIPGAHAKGAYGLQNNEFLFDFPKFGDLPGGHLFNGPANKKDQSKSNDNVPRAPGVLGRDSLNSPSSRSNSLSQSNKSKSTGTSTNATSTKSPYSGFKPSANDKSTTSENSPSSSSDSHQSQMLSSNGTSPEPSMNSSPNGQYRELGPGDSCGGHVTTDGEKSFCEQLGMACGNIRNPIPAVRDSRSKSQSVSSGQPTPIDGPAGGEGSQDLGIDWLAHQNGGQFDPVLFGDWREPQDAVLSQDFGSFFNEAFPLPDLGSPSHNLSEVATDAAAPKKNLISQIDNKLEEDEVVPGEDQSQMLSCTKIWDRLQSMERFRNGEIDVDNLCSELRTKARCSEGGVVVNQNDVDDIMGRVK
ncbi:transcriptional regulator family: bZIP [Penicillium psychrosexuale]|uniref:transcriptional regulator family: bZIP n=1 Tax=Penicillium psychrosexuale TaxID=1002107 RepID=UPI00254599C9|nr:transcriptional regulator family: bZIP [Penicillium psychrosexuale]KAJ5784137.1 transcriptional regulator family: bZIP [Penicillium psychrosexuale]